MYRRNQLQGRIACLALQYIIFKLSNKFYILWVCMCVCTRLCVHISVFVYGKDDCRLLALGEQFTWCHCFHQLLHYSLSAFRIYAPIAFLLVFNLSTIYTRSIARHCKWLVWPCQCLRMTSLRAKIRRSSCWNTIANAALNANVTILYSKQELRSLFRLA